MKKSRRKRWAWHVARMGKKRNAHSVLVRKTKGNKSLGRQKRCRWEKNIKTYH
jgi:hypothetical protein